MEKSNHHESIIRQVEEEKEKIRKKHSMFLNEMDEEWDDFL
jgi:hypothetical protein